MKKFRLVWLFTILLFFIPTIPIQYLYPVAAKDDHVYCIYQSSPEIIRMLTWDYSAKELMPGLLPHFMPAGLRMLPNNVGYSFIDDGILRVQKFIKRSPKALEFTAPIYDINVPEWIDENTGFFAAKVREHYGIFQFDIDANLAGLLLDSKKDFLYPQKAGSHLFYIERIKRGLGFQFRIMCIPYPVNVTMLSEDEMVAFKPAIYSADAVEVFDFHNEPIAFLHMENETSAFLISYPAHIEEDATTIACSYYQLAQAKDGVWHEYKLFDFIIPAGMLISESRTSTESDSLSVRPEVLEGLGYRLYESILPLLPRHIGTNIYFVDCSNSDQNLNLNVYEYNTIDQSEAQLTYADQPDQHYFAPILINSSLYCGGSGYGDRLHFIKVIF